MNIARFWLYLILILFFAAAIVSFRLIDHGLKLVFLAKAGTTFIAMLAMAIAIMTVGTGHELFVHPPIYRHLRHLNYDLIVVAALGFSSWLGATKKARYGYVAMFLALGYFSIWSGGRGEALALIVFFAALLGFGVTQWREKHFQVTLAALLLGGILVIGSGQTQFLSGQLERSVAASADRISSGRLKIWQTSLARAEESPAALIFGFGPDAFVRLGIYRDVWPEGNSYIVHPHNSLVQWILEFGVAGTLLIVLFLMRTGAIAISLLRRGAPADIPKTAAALFLALLCYSMVDGVFYHAIPLTMITLLSGYLYVCQPDFRTSTGHRESRSVSG